ncbi:MAG: hypothetical protein ACP5KZ_07345 [bacterium]
MKKEVLKRHFYKRYGRKERAEDEYILKPKGRMPEESIQMSKDNPPLREGYKGVSPARPMDGFFTAIWVKIRNLERQGKDYSKMLDCIKGGY